MISSPPSPQNPEPYLPPIPPDARYAPPGSFGEQALPPVPQNSGLPPVPGSSPVRRVVPFNQQPQQQALPPVPNNSVYRGPEKPAPAALSPIPRKAPAPTSPASGTVRSTSLNATAFKPIAQPPPKRVFCPAAIDLMDESITLFFRLPLSILATYYVACLPLFIAFAWFWHDMRNGVNSNMRVLPEALVLTVLFCLMKVGQAAFCSKVYHRLAASEDQPWTLWRIHHVGVLQTIYAGSFFIIYPASFLITFPFPWVNSFYHNIALTASDSKATISSSFKEASKLSLLWPGKNAFGFMYQFILAFIVLTNLVSAAVVTPLFLKYFLNIDSSFSENPAIFFSSSEFLFVLILCFLITNPINKIYHVLRCFYGRSRSSGVDLVSALRVRKSAAVALVVLIISATFLSIGPLRADSDNAPAPPASDTRSTDTTAPPKPENQPTPKPADAFHLDQKGKTLDQAIDKTLSGGGTDYDWRTGDPTRDPLLAFPRCGGKVLG